MPLSEFRHLTYPIDYTSKFSVQNPELSYYIQCWYVQNPRSFSIPLIYCLFKFDEWIKRYGSSKSGSRKFLSFFKMQIHVCTMNVHLVHHVIKKLTVQYIFVCEIYTSYVWWYRSILTRIQRLFFHFLKNND